MRSHIVYMPSDASYSFDLNQVTIYSLIYKFITIWNIIYLISYTECSVKREMTAVFHRRRRRRQYGWNTIISIYVRPAGRFDSGATICKDCNTPSGYRTL